MNSSNLGSWIVVILAWTVYIIIPTANIIYAVVSILRMKKIISGLGDKKVRLESRRQTHIAIKTVYSLFILAAAVFLFFVTSRILAILVFTVFFQSWIHALKGDLFSKANGIYAMGYIFDDNPVLWKNIHSYKLIPDGGISLLTDQGARVDLPVIRDFDTINFFGEVGVEEEK